MHHRRDFIRTSAAGLLGMAGLSSIPRLGAAVAGPGSAAAGAGVPRFIFLRKSNGTFPTELVPPSLSEADKKKDAHREALDIDLDRQIKSRPRSSGDLEPSRSPGALAAIGRSLRRRRG